VVGLIIYDFDGVIAECEVLANTVLAEIVTELGVPTSLEDSYRLYMGKRFAEVMSAIEGSVGRVLPETFPSEFQARTLRRFREELRLVEGARLYRYVCARCRAASPRRPYPIAWRCASRCSGFNRSSVRTSSVRRRLREASRFVTSSSLPLSAWMKTRHSASFLRTALQGCKRQLPQG